MVFTDFHSPIDCSALEIARRIAAGETCAVEVAKAHIARIEAVNRQLNALVVPRFEAALKEAAAADQRRARGEPLGLLHGVPITLKECFLVAGTPSTIGLDAPQWRQAVSEDGIIARRLRRAGAVILGKTNLPQLMLWHEADNPVYGRTNNPWDLDRTPGGSTGGEAALIAAGGSPLGIGNDLGGSIRVPCHWCGIHGIKPTSFRLPRSGSVNTLRGFEAIVTQPGPMARHVKDLWLALRVLADPGDGYVGGDVLPGPLPDPSAVSIQRLRVACWTDDGVFPASAAVNRAVRQAAEALRAAGAEVIELDAAAVDRAFSTSQAFDLYCSLVAADGGADARRQSRASTIDWRIRRLLLMAGLPLTLRAGIVGGWRLAGQKTLARLIARARPRSADGYWQLVDRRSELMRRAIGFMQQQRMDVVLCPPHATPAPHHTHAFDLLPAASYAFLFNLLGWPAGVVSITRVRPGEEEARPDSRDRVLQRARGADRASTGLPVGVQLAALPWREDIVIAGMAAIEHAFRAAADYPAGLRSASLPLRQP